MDAEGLPEPRENVPVRERFYEIVCGFAGYMLYALVIEVILLVLALFSLLFVTRGTASHAILQFDLIVLVVTLTLTATMLYVCTRRE